jgi:hypothetical protein
MTQAKRQVIANEFCASSRPPPSITPIMFKFDFDVDEEPEESNKNALPEEHNPGSELAQVDERPFVEHLLAEMVGHFTQIHAWILTYAW